MTTRLPVLPFVLAAVLVLWGAIALARTGEPPDDAILAADPGPDGSSPAAEPSSPTSPPPSSPTSPPPSPGPTPLPTPEPTPETWPDLAGGVNAPWGEVEGLTMFRGNPTRTWYGTGPIPAELEVQWTFPDEPMCGNSPVFGEDKVWCGTGWTGQPVVWERPDGVTEVIVGAYDKAIHFLDAETGERTRDDFDMGDIIKGSVSLDPDGWPLLYAGSRDEDWRIIALDRDEPEELWSLSADAVPGMWNDDWDSNPVVVDGVVYVGGENSWWFAIELGRELDDDGLVTVDPDIVFDMPAFTDELVAEVGRQQSVENSTAVFEDRAYFANSAGRVVGVDIADLPDGDAEVVLDFWMGDDVDASIVADPEGDIYVSAEVDLATDRGEEVGQLVKLDPDQPDDPLVWSLDIPPAGGFEGGIWATPAWRDGLLYVPTQPGELLVVDADTGEVVWSDDVGGWAQSSPVLAGDRLLVAVDCFETPALRVYDLTDPRDPERLGESQVTAGCIESTPAAWKGQVFVGSRDGYLYGLGPAQDTPSEQQPDGNVEGEGEGEGAGEDPSPES